MVGVSVDLPQPFTKDLDQGRALHLEIEFNDDGELVSGAFGNEFNANVLFKQGEIETGQLNFNILDSEFGFIQEISTEPGIVIRGELDYLNYEDWNAVAEAFADPQLGSDEENEFEKNIRMADLYIQDLEVAGIELLEVNTQVRRGEREWNVLMQNELLDGRFNFPDNSADPYVIVLEYLRLSSSDEDAEINELDLVEEEIEEIDFFAEIDPRSLPDMNFYTEEFSLGENNLGSWEFELRTNETGASITDFRVSMDDAKITDETGENGARIEWFYENGAHRTDFIGLFEAGDLAQVMPSWGLDANVESQFAQFQGNLQWQGSPAAFSLIGSSGVINVNIDDGQFVDIDSGSSRLLGAFNMDSLIRRLQLDFSDLYQTGFTFDTIDGNLFFKEGIVSTDMDGEFIIVGPSSRISIDGEIDLVNETILADMLVTVPFSQNISLLAGIMGAWPLAVGAYVASKVFQDQMAGLTTIVYQLEGPWENLDTRFETPERLGIEIPVEEISQ
jgi:uncharacterized protein YhdP